MSGAGRCLPEFERPPVAETILGVQFSPLTRWTALHFGLFWNEVSADYPFFEPHPPLGSQIEAFGDESRRHQREPIIKVVAGEPSLRYWFIDSSRTGLIQVQADQFIHNWRKATGADVYPRYETIRPRFEREWDRFCAFLAAHSLGSPEAQQCEVTYINHIERGQGWRNFADLADITPMWSSPSRGFLPAPEVAVLSLQFVIPENQGRLHVTLQPAIRQADAREVLQLALTARGRPASSATQDILRWFDIGREWVVRGFTDFTSNKMHELWGRKA
jgi:uncharacterized protein (TIGR04255 family)